MYKKEEQVILFAQDVLKPINKAAMEHNHQHTYCHTQFQVSGPLCHFFILSLVVSVISY